MKIFWKVYRLLIRFLIWFLFPFAVTGQSTNEIWKDQRKIYQHFQKIQQGVEWSDIYNFVEDSLPNYHNYLRDILHTQYFLDTIIPSNKVDSLFIQYCTKGHQYLPIHASGNLTIDMYRELVLDTNSLDYLIHGPDYKGDFPELVKITADSANQHLLHLIPYLENDAATRIVFFPQTNPFKLPTCLKISDVAMELIEIISKCDFHSYTYSFTYFSNEPDTIQDRVKSNIQKWISNTYHLPDIMRMTYFLDSIGSDNRGYFNTCKNMLFLKDSVYVFPYLLKYYQKTRHFEAGKILLLLGNDQLVNDCLHKSMACKVITDGPLTGSILDCINIALSEGYVNELDTHFSKLIGDSIDPLTNQPMPSIQATWQSIVYYTPHFVKPMPKTLLHLLKINSTVSDLPESIRTFLKSNYSDELSIDFRVCDFALLMYSRTIREIKLHNWKSVIERNEAIKQVLASYNR